MPLNICLAAHAEHKPQSNPVDWDTVAAQARQDFVQMKEAAGAATRKLGNIAQNFMKDLQGGY